MVKEKRKASEKQKVAFSSVIAAVFLTVIKVIVGIFTGSLGIVSEALHSGMDLFAAGITLFAVRFSDKPADVKHNYGHGKMESFSALIEVLILLGTCAWVIAEAIDKFISPQDIQVSGEYWGIAVLIVSIIINISRAKILRKTAKKYGSQALEADALHFSTDVWSSGVVIAGLGCTWIGDAFHIGWLKFADPIAALGVAVLIMVVSFKLGRETINVLLDAAPKGMKEQILAQTKAVKGVIEVGDIRVRPSGADSFIDIRVGLDRHESHRTVHNIGDEIKARVQEKIPKSDIVVSTYPVDLVENMDRDVCRAVKNIVSFYPECANVHNIHVYESEGRKRIAAHIELKENATLKESHALSHRLEKEIEDALPDITHVSIAFECADQKATASAIPDAEQAEIKGDIVTLVGRVDETLDCHEIELYRKGEGISAFLHCASCEDYTVDKLKSLSNSIKLELKRNIEHLESVHIHFEPSEES